MKKTVEYADGFTPTAAVGLQTATPTAVLTPTGRSSLVVLALYANGSDIWPSAYKTAVGVAAISCSVYFILPLIRWRENEFNLYIST